jgi:low molecular weight protein-tyrosine phosphatase
MLRDEGSSAAQQETAGDRFQLLFLCTGNRCRSPLAEALVRQVTSDLPMVVASAGLLPLGSAPAAPEMTVVAARYGVDLSAHRSRSLSPLEPPYPDLVVGFERVHAAAAVVDAHVPAERVFILKEIVRLLDKSVLADPDDPVARARAAVAFAHRTRLASSAFVPGEDIQDPYGGPSDGYVDMSLEVHDLCTRLVTGLFGTAAEVRG